MTRKFLFAAPLALAAGAILATPALAATWNAPGQLRAEIAQLDRQVERTRGLSRTEQARLGRQVDRLQDLYRSYARGGFTRGESQRLDNRIAAVRAEIARQAHDRDGRYGHNDRDDHKGNDHNDRNDRDSHRDRNDHR